MKIARRIVDIPTFGIRKIFNLTGSGSINFGLKEPYPDPPSEAIRGMNAAAIMWGNKYGPTADILELMGTIADYYSRYGRLEGGNIMVTPSVSTALLKVAQNMVDSEDEVLNPSPGFVIYDPRVEFAGGKTIEHRLTDDGRF